MVNLKHGKIVALALISLATVSGCSLKHWLGENPPPTKIVSKAEANSQSSSGEDCASWTKIYEGTEEESQATFECWAAKEPDVWKKIRGSHPDELSEREISLIVRNGIISMEGGAAEREIWIRRLLALKNLLGFGPTVTKARVDRWISWLRAHRSDIRNSYQKLVPFEKANSFKYPDLQAAALTAASFLREIGWSKSSSELSTLLTDAFVITDKQTLTGLEPGLRVLRNFLGFICPLESDPNRLASFEVAHCFEKASAHYQPSARWIEFMINDKSAILETEAAQVRQSIETAAPLIQKWFAQPHMSPVDTRLLLEWAKAMGAHPPENFIDSLKLLRRLNTKSNELAIYPTEMNRVFALIRDYEFLVLDALPHFSRAYHKNACKNRNAQSWKECILPDLSVREKSRTIDMLLRVKNPRHGIDAVPLSGSVMSAVAFFNSAAGQCIELFDDDKDGVISVNIGPDGDELVNFITSSIETYQSIEHYISNLSRRLDGKPVSAFTDDDNINLSQWNLSAFAKLVSSANDVLVERTKPQRSLIEKVLANVSHSFPKSSVFLDKPAITAILTTLTSLPHYRQTALEAMLGDKVAAQAVMDANKPFPREFFRAHIGDMLNKNFPRTYQRCMEFGFEASCFIAFDEVMPSPDEARKLVTPSDIDVITIMAAGMEGVFDTCGNDKDGKLSYSLFDGDDELDCGYTRMKDVGIRLIDSGIVRVSPNVRSLAETALKTIDSVFLTRTIGKVALIRGTTSGALLNMPFFWAFGKYATIGSSYGLLSDIVASDRVKEAKSKAR